MHPITTADHPGHAGTPPILRSAASLAIIPPTKDSPSASTSSPWSLDRAPSEAASPARRWTVYILVRWRDGRCHVGLTCRSLETRLRGHLYQARSNRPIHQSGLTEALRSMLARDQDLADAFSAKAIAVVENAEAAQQLERRWITYTGSRKPHGSAPIGEG